MEMKDFTTTITVEKSSREVFEIITKDVAKWWGGKDLTGSSTKLNDEFVICHPGQHYSKQRVTEFIPGTRLAWDVTDSEMSWLNDKTEWTGTRMIFELTPDGNKTLLRFTHEGLAPAKECYVRVSQGWNMIITDWLFSFITEGAIKIDAFQAQFD